MTLAYDDTGNAPTAVLLVHAFPVHRAMWSGVRAALGDGVRLITPDLPGFGESHALAEVPSLDVYADAVVELMDELDLATAVVGGVSMGGYVSMAVARRHPDRVAGLVLADTKATADSVEARGKRERIATLLTEEQSVRVLVDESLPALTGPTSAASRPEVLATVRALVQAADPNSAAWAQHAMAARPDSVELLRELTMPVLVLVGDEDIVTPVAAAEEMATAAAGAELVVLPGTGHLSAVEDPPAFAAALTAFVQRLG